MNAVLFRKSRKRNFYKKWHGAIIFRIESALLTWTDPCDAWVVLALFYFFIAMYAGHACFVGIVYR